ncbi:hypothetical protein [Pseudomonas sp. F1002]|uniref:hypothetical protein n=1 Tax=Pseudomonas sp. F1002 TaxID=2738821 RepID=UPI0015A1CECA|nr:hypothetical protein [Pseudomonas sp. F1002]NWB63698.1 hypothetical protein [Pseudomonas sp. F1002]
MSDFFQETPAAIKWAEEAEQRHKAAKFGEIVRAVIWTDARSSDGQLLVPVDPDRLVAKINSDPFTLLENHDPGRPKGQLLESASFESSGGRKFVAAILGYYAGGDVLSFLRLGIDVDSPAPPPQQLPRLLDDVWVEVATDAREVDEDWLDQITNDSPVRVERSELSHNAAESLQELIRVGLPYVVLVWNPFVTAIATEAGKASYAGIHAWLRKLLSRMSDRRNPILDFHSHQDGCQVSFLFRGKDEKKLHEAMDALAGAAAQAARLISKLKTQGKISRQMVYEFDKEKLLWTPSFVLLNDDRIITDNLALIAIENLPKGLSLGLTRSNSP